MHHNHSAIASCMDLDDASVLALFYQQFLASNVVNNNSTQHFFDHASSVENIMALPILFFYSSNTKYTKRNKVVITTFIELDLIIIAFMILIISWIFFLTITFRFLFIILIHKSWSSYLDIV